MKRKRRKMSRRKRMKSRRKSQTKKNRLIKKWSNSQNVINKT